MTTVKLLRPAAPGSAPARSGADALIFAEAERILADLRPQPGDTFLLPRDIRHTAKP